MAVEPSFKNRASTSLEVQIYDDDTLGSHDFLGRAVLNIAQLLTIDPAPDAQGFHLVPEDVQGGGGSCGGKTKRDPTKPYKKWQWNSCGSIEIQPPSGFFNATPVPLGRLEFMFMSAFNLLAANMNGKSDPYIKIRVKDNLCHRVTKKDSYFKEPGGNKVFRTSVKAGTLNPVW